MYNDDEELARGIHVCTGLMLWTRKTSQNSCTIYHLGVSMCQLQNDGRSFQGTASLPKGVGHAKQRATISTPQAPRLL